MGVEVVILAIFQEMVRGFGFCLGFTPLFLFLKRKVGK